MTLDETWYEYVGRVFEDLDVSVTQYKETHLAFYAGGWAVLSILAEATKRNPPSVAAKTIEALRLEIQAFLRDESILPQGEELPYVGKEDNKGQPKGSS